MRCSIVLSAALLLPARAIAGGADEALPQQTRCESHGLERQHCALDTGSGVQMVRQLSETSCIRGSEWDLEPGGIWVALGCRADFRALRADAAPLMRRVVRCESDGRQESCPVLLKGAPVRLLRQLSAWPCKEGRSWGTRRNEIWVSRGCDAEFEVGAEDGSGFVDAPRMVTCESKSRARRMCGVTVEHDVRLGRQMSNTSCIEGSTWGWSRDGIWVDGGCRGEFVVN
jgi:hypothetical protein